VIKNSTKIFATVFSKELFGRRGYGINRDFQVKPMQVQFKVIENGADG